MSNSTGVPRQGIQAGAAEVDITPQVGGYLAGGIHKVTSRSVERRLFARALVLQQTEQPVIMIVCDLLLLRRETVTHTRTIISDRLGLPEHCITISVTHTHSGPATIASAWWPPPDSSYMEQLPLQLAEAAITAYRRREPAQLAYGTQDVHGVCFNRRYVRDDGIVETNPGLGRTDILGPAGPTDPAVTALLVERPNGQPIALWANLSLHYVGTSDREAISADYYGAFSELAKRWLGTEVIALLTNGASGDINNNDLERKVAITGTGRQELVARAVAGAAIAATAMAPRVHTGTIQIRTLPFLASTYPVTTNDLQVAREILTHPDTSPTFSFVRGQPIPSSLATQIARGIESFRSRPRQQATELALIQIADLCIVSMPGEIFVEHGLRIKALSPFPLTAVVGLSNDYIGYLPTRDAFQRGGYETWRNDLSWTDIGTGEAMVDLIAQEFASVTRSA